MDLHFTKYRVSTITSNATIVFKLENTDEVLFNQISIIDQDLNVDNINKVFKKVNSGIKSINLIKLFNNLTIKDKSGHYLCTQRIDENGERIIRGEYPKKRRTGSKKRTFDNQISFVFKMNEDYYPNIKVFQNGNIHITGSRSIEDIEKPLKVLIEEIKRIYQEVDKDIIEFDDIINIDCLEYSDIQIFMINTDFKIFTDQEKKNNFTIKRRVLHDLLIQDDKVIARFDPATYPGVKIEYWWDKSSVERNGSLHLDKRNVKSKSTIKDGIKKVTIAVFESGSVLITGAVSIEQVDEAYEYICKVLNENKEKIYFNI